MRNKDYRELQISSSVLIFIFLGIVIVGIVIFLLGVSVGKKQVQMAHTSLTPQDRFEEVIEDKPKPVTQGRDDISQELAGHEDTKRGAEAESPAELVTEPKVKSAPPPQQTVAREKKAPPKPEARPTASDNPFYLQIGAFRSKESADSVIEKYRSMGFSGQVLNPGANDRRQLYRVILGGFPTRAAAEQAKSRLVETEGPKAEDYFIIQR
jgi:cell division protein FtsN